MAGSSWVTTTCSMCTTLPVDVMVTTVSLGNEPAGSLIVHIYTHVITTKSSD